MAEHKIQDPRDAVSAVYRAILRRDPDPNGLALYTAVLAQEGLQRVLETFLTCPEYRALSRQGPNPDLNWESKMSIQRDLSDGQMDQLWDHVSTVWTGLGSLDPYWSVLTDERFRATNMSDLAIVEEFYGSGIGDLKYLRAFLDRADLELRSDMVVAEYGCGLGRVTRFLAKEANRVLAFDISSTHLDAARQRMRQEGISNVEFVHVTDRSSLAHLARIDLFFSLIVLQHNPPPVMLSILDAAFAGLRPGGLAFFQVPTYSLGYSFDLVRFMEREGRAKAMEMHFLPQEDILRTARARDMQLIEVRADHLVGNYERWLSNTFLMQKS